jgi:hypothetical protein
MQKARKTSADRREEMAGPMEPAAILVLEMVSKFDRVRITDGSNLHISGL